MNSLTKVLLVKYLLMLKTKRKLRCIQLSNKCLDFYTVGYRSYHEIAGSGVNYRE